MAQRPRTAARTDTADRTTAAAGPAPGVVAALAVLVPGLGHLVLGRARKAAADALRRSHDELREMSAAMNEVREAERTRIARELHDELGQLLTAVKMDIAWLAARLPPESTALAQRSEKMRQLIDTTVAAVRRIAADLRPVMLDDFGLMPALEHLLNDFAQRTSIATRMDASTEEVEFGEPLSTSVYRIVQEALTNVARHAEATEVELTIKLEADSVYVRVRDNGKGLVPRPSGGRPAPRERWPSG